MSEESQKPEAPKTPAPAPEVKAEQAAKPAAPAPASAPPAPAASAPAATERPASAARPPRRDRERGPRGERPEAKKPEGEKPEGEKSEKSEKPESAAPAAGGFPLADAPQAPVQRKRGKRHVPEAIVHVTATFNNTIVTFADAEGKVIAWATTGSSGFKGARKGTPYAAQIAAENAGRKAQEHGVESVEVRVRGVGSGRDSAVRAINALGIRIGCIRDVTPVPHNGCRPPKRRRV